MVQKRRLSTAFAHKISHWRHGGGFQVYCSQTVQADDRQALERLAAYILRPSFAATRLRYQPSIPLPCCCPRLPPPRFLSYIPKTPGAPTLMASC